MHNKGGEINVPQIIADSIQETTEDYSKGTRLGHPSTILRLCKKARVLFEVEDTDWVSEGKPINKQRMEYVTGTQSQRRPHRRKRGIQSEEGQAPNTFDLSQIQSAIEGISQQYMKAQEQQEEFQLKMIDQQREFQSRLLDQ